MCFITENCECTQTKEANFVTCGDGYSACEYDLICVECGAIVDHWAYGNFESSMYEAD